jgi:hypothetical protein
MIPIYDSYTKSDDDTPMTGFARSNSYGHLHWKNKLRLDRPHKILMETGANLTKKFLYIPL